MSQSDQTAALERALRVADQSCTAYALLRDKYRDRALALDLAILVVSTWLTALSFVSDEIARTVTPAGFTKDLWQGLLSVIAFAVSLVQLQVNWKGRAQLFQQASGSLSAFVKEYRSLVSSPDDAAVRNSLIRYQTLTDALEPVPESKFLALKKRHKIKVEISKVLDVRPGASVTLLRLKIWYRDNFG